MPTYSYACKNCGHQFDIHQAFSDNALTDCPECGGQLRKVFNSVGVVFKGSGFYRTDSRDKSSSTGGTSSEKSSAASSGSSDSASKSGSDSSSSGSSAPKVDKPASSSASSSTSSSSSSD
ncbi:FmdB family zinc ribbon protein [Yimella sp. cx-51]|uniref:FmdB family zinc ribbon protein n=1 Tax=Yimella sp. cx-51 TaxID=2770551 RepID=UPI00165D5601|nr:FmdB family zinc ribbon protein [Yimella sp. cx-51]MBC9956212.1 FmdB family transcriptional regulator [Yimella sp. cx-51]QTH38641.1 FmdB family transcriptional regulator [Yimella sp. cx-51]